MKCWCNTWFLAVGLFFVLTAAALATAIPSAIELQADRDARFEVGQKLAAEHPDLLVAWQKVAAAAGPLNAAQADVNKYTAQQNALAGPIQQALWNIKDQEGMGQSSNGVLYLPPSAYYMVEQWKKKLADLQSQQQIVDDHLSAARQTLDQAQGAYTEASNAYMAQLQDLKQEYDKLFQEAYPRHLKALQDQAKEAQTRLSQVFIVQDLLPGEYTWSENAKDLGKITITADGKITGVPPDGRAGTWKVTATGLEVVIGTDTWLFKPGPMFTLIGTGKAAGSTVAKQAMLRPTVLPDQAAYNAALQKLKDAAKKAAAEQAASAAKPADQPAAAQPGQPAAAQPGQPAAAQPGQPAAAQPAPSATPPADPAQAPVTLKTPYPGPDPNRMALQAAVKEMARQAGLGYDFDTSFKNTNPACRQWVTPSIQGLPFAQAMDGLLGPVGLAYDVVNNQVVLRRK